MAIAKGAKAQISYDVETILNEQPSLDTGVYTGLPFSSEGLVENINEFLSDELRDNRSVTGSRGGNIATGGSLRQDFAPHRHFRMLHHLLGGVAFADDQLTPAAWAADPQTYARYDGTDPQYVITDDNNVYFIKQGGTAGATKPTHTEGDGFDSGADVVYQYLTTGASFSPNKVTWSGGDLPIVGLRLLKDIRNYGASSDGLLSIAYAGTRINTATITIPQEGICTIEWGLTGQRSYANTGTVGGSDSYAGTYTAQASDEPFSGLDCFVGFDVGTTSRPIREATINFTNNVDENVYTIGTRYRREAPEGRRQVTGSFTTYMEDATEYEAFKAESNIDLRFEFVRFGRVFTIHLPKVKITGQGTPAVSGEGPMTASYNFSASFDDTATYDVQMVLYTELPVATVQSNYEK